MNFENEEQANAYMNAATEGEVEARAAHDLAVAETKNIEIIKAILMAGWSAHGVRLTKEQRNMVVELAEEMQTELDALREANAHKNAVIEDLMAGNKRLDEEVETVAKANGIYAAYEAVKSGYLKHEKQIKTFAEQIEELQGFVLVLSNSYPEIKNRMCYDECMAFGPKPEKQEDLFGSVDL